MWVNVCVYVCVYVYVEGSGGGVGGGSCVYWGVERVHNGIAVCPCESRFIVSSRTVHKQHH